MVRPRWVIAGILLAALAMRLALLATGLAMTNGDEAQTGLMALDILHGRALPIYTYGYTYNGGAAMTAYVAALFFRVAGTSDFSLKLVPLIVSLLYLWAVYAFVRRFFGEGAALVAGCLLLVDVGGLPWYLDARGAQVIHLALSVVLAGIFYDLYFIGTGRWSRHFLFGLVAGVGHWNFPFMLPLAAGFVVLLALAEGHRFLRRGLPLAALGALAGLAPVTTYHLAGNTGCAVRGAAIQLDLAAFPRNLARILAMSLPELFSLLNVVSAYSWLLLAIALTCVAYVAITHRAGLHAFLRALVAFGRSVPQREEPAARVWPLIAFLPAYVVAAALVRVGASTPRYLLPLAPFLTILTAIAMAHLLARRTLWRVLGGAFLATFAIIGLCVQGHLLFTEKETTLDYLRAPDGETLFLNLRQADFDALMKFLADEDIGCVYAASELRSKIMFASVGRILASSRWLTPQHDFLPTASEEVERRVSAGAKYAFVCRRDMLLCIKGRREPNFPERWAAMLAGLRAQGVRWQQREIGGLVVYYDFDRDVRAFLP